MSKSSQFVGYGGNPCGNPASFSSEKKGVLAVFQRGLPFFFRVLESVLLVGFGGGQHRPLSCRGVAVGETAAPFS